MTIEQFEVDRGLSGKIKINVVSVANLIALIALIGTAFATWNGLTSKVDIMGVRVETATSQVTQIRTDLQTSLISRDVSQRELRDKVDQMGNRLTAVETIMKRVEIKLDNAR